MIRNARLFLLSNIFLFLLLACAPGEKEADMQARLEELDNSLKVYREGVAEGDLDKFMSAWAEDAIRLEDGINAINGKEAIREHFRPYFETMDTRITLYGERKMEISGDMAYGYSNFILSASPKGSDTVMHSDFKFFELYKRQKDGRWLLQVGSAMTNPPWTGDMSLEDLLKDEDESVPRL